MVAVPLLIGAFALSLPVGLLIIGQLFPPPEPGTNDHLRLTL
jgi:hypothetical protein